MKKIICMALASLIFLLCLVPSFAAPTPRIGEIIDETGSVSEEHKKQIEDIIREAGNTHGYSVIIVFRDYLSEYEDVRNEETESFYSSRHYQDRGIMLSVGVKSRTYDIYSVHFDEFSHITEDELDTIDNAVYNMLSSNRFSEAALIFALRSMEAIEGGGTETYYFGGKTTDDLLSGIGISFVIGFFAALITVLIMKSNMKTVKRQRSAGGYIIRDSVDIYNSRDRFLYSSISKVRRSTDSSSGGGGGSRTSSRSSGGSHRGGRF